MKQMKSLKNFLILLRYQEKSEQSMRGSEFVFRSVDQLHYKCHKISLKRVGSNIDSPEWLKKQKKHQ